MSRLGSECTVKWDLQTGFIDDRVWTMRICEKSRMLTECHLTINTEFLCPEMGQIEEKRSRDWAWAH